MTAITDRINTVFQPPIQSQPTCESLLIKVAQLQEIIIQLQNDLKEKPPVVSGNVYRMICPECKKEVDIAASTVQSQKTPGVYGEPASQNFYARCTRCTSMIHFGESMDMCIKQKRIFQLFIP